MLYIYFSDNCSIKYIYVIIIIKSNVDINKNVMNVVDLAAIRFCAVIEVKKGHAFNWSF